MVENYIFFAVNQYTNTQTNKKVTFAIEKEPRDRTVSTNTEDFIDNFLLVIGVHIGRSWCC